MELVGQGGEQYLGGVTMIRKYVFQQKEYIINKTKILY